MPVWLGIILGVAGGLGLFIFGMKSMAEGLQKAAGDRLRRILEMLTFNRYVAVLTGIVITVLVQSSSTTTVMMVGFVNAGLMTLTQAVGTILGANIGTTVTAQIIAFKITELALPAIALGVVLSFFFKRRIHKNIGQAVLGFGFLFLGMSVMGDKLSVLRDYPASVDFLATFGQVHILGILAGAVFTVAVQSSSASTATILVLAGSGVLNLESAMAMVLGTNIGTCITALLASIGTSLGARRTAMAHVLFNFIGVLIFYFLLTPFTEIVRSSSSDLARQVANGHLVFNVASTLLFLPFLSWFVALIVKLVPGEDAEVEVGPQYIDRRMLNTPSVALGAAEREIARMADIALEMVDDAVGIIIQNKPNLIKAVERKEEVVDELEKEIGVYLAEVTQRSITGDQSRLVSNYLHAINDIERVADHAENIANLGLGKHEDNLPFSESAVEELADMYSKVRQIYAKSVEAYKTKNKELAREVLVDDNEIDRMEKRLRKQHVARINQGRCFPPSGVIFLDILSNFERIGDHATNLAQVVLGEF